MTKEEYIQKNLDELIQVWGVRAAVVGAGIFMVLSGLDVLVAPEHFRTFLLYRIVIAAVLIGIAVLVSRPANPVRHRVLVYAAVLGSAVTIELMVLHLGGHASPYYVGMILLGVAVLGFIPGRFSQHAVVAVTIYLVYLVPIMATDRIVDTRSFIMANMFLVQILSVVLLQRYLSDSNLIKELGQRYEIERYRLHLEDLVSARTEELGRTVSRLKKEIDVRKQAEAQLQRSADDLRERNEDLNWFAYSIAHDLRAPLLNIKGFSTELARSIQENLALIDSPAGELKTEQRSKAFHALLTDVPAAVGFVNTSADRMNTLLNAMLKLLLLARRPLRPERIDLMRLVQETLTGCSRQLGEKNLTVTVGPLPQVVADAQSMEEIMQKLLDNAIKYSPNNPGAKIEIMAERNEQETVVHIRDNGRGIAKDDIPKVFEIFRRVGNQDVPSEGMGLAYAKTLVRRHGGRIWCESQLGAGTTFSFTIPAMAEQPYEPGTLGGLS
jgi:signal transduction histidine kinase